MARWFWLAAAWLSMGCADGSLGEAVTVGEVDESDAMIGLVEHGDQGELYVCGGDTTRGTHTRWFQVQPDGDGLVGEADGWEVRGSVDGDGWSGEIASPEGVIQTWSTRALGGPLEGLYRADEGACPVGVVVTDAGARMQGVFCPRLGEAAQVVPVGQIVLEDEGLRVQALSEPPVEFFVTPVLP